jgi:mRNA-degrading endonuclease toxin of MazEF toxin-antitoxin module
MLDALKTLFENDVVSEEIRAQIEEAWNAKVTENRQSVASELREEFAQKYEHDKSVMVDAIDTMLTQGLAEEIQEFADDRKQLAEAKAKYAVKMRENAELLKGFVVDQLQNEIQELRADKKAMAENYAKLEEFVVEALSSEISEFHEDKKDLAETKVRLVREAKTHFAKVKKNFIERSADLVSETVSKTLNKEITSLKEDIDHARENDFGRKIFEAFSSEYGLSHLNEKSETAKLMKVINLKDKQLAEAKTIAKKSLVLAESKEAEKQRLIETATREKKLNSLVGPLAKDQREIMTDLLESVQTSRLDAAFEKYLPAVIDGNSPAKKKATLKEGKEITGNREIKTQVSSNNAGDNVLDIRRLAGLS